MKNNTFNEHIFIKILCINKLKKNTNIAGNCDEGRGGSLHAIIA